MSEAEFKKLDELYAKKINLRVKEIAERFIWTDGIAVEVSAVQTLRHLDIAEAKKLKYHPVKDGYVWGQPWGTAWFRLRCNVPLSFQREMVSVFSDRRRSYYIP